MIILLHTVGTPQLFLLSCGLGVSWGEVVGKGFGGSVCRIVFGRGRLVLDIVWVRLVRRWVPSD